jgi:hypothetical protein
MATPQNDEPSGIIESVSKFAGTVVGSAVITGKRIIGSAKTKVPKTKKKKVVKRKRTGSPDKSGASKKKRTHSPAKKKEGLTPKEKTTQNDMDIKCPSAD